MRRWIPVLLVAAVASSGCSLFRGSSGLREGGNSAMLRPPDHDLSPPPPGAMSRSGGEATVTQAILSAAEGDGQYASVQLPQ